MLVMFKFRNFGPFKEETVFDMRAIKSYKEHPYNLIREDNKCSLLKVGAIYGANASGKSNFVTAYKYFRNIVRNSFKKNDKDDSSILSSNFFPFLFGDETECNSTEFEGIFHYNNSEYRYGFIYNEIEVEYEWLYKRSIATNRQSKIFERSFENIELGSTVRKSCEKYLSDIDSDVLALSFFSSLKLKTMAFKEAVHCITNFLPLSLSCDRQSGFMLDHYFEKDFNDEEKPNLLTFLNAIDVGIKDIKVEKNKNITTVITFHLGKDGTLYPVPFEIESDGTKRAIAIYSFVRIAVLYNKGLIIDEFNNQLHPLLQRYIIDLFYKESTHGQLIYTTHDTFMMNSRFTRRDQIWFIEKNEAGESSLYSLAEFKIRNDKTSFEKDYLGGVYGGIPILKDFAFMEG